MRTRPKAASFKQLLKYLEQDGWRMEHRTGGHLKLTSPTGAVVFTSSTPSDRRAIRNIEKDLKGAGWRPRSSTLPR